MKVKDLSKLKSGAKGPKAKAEVPGVQSPRRRIISNPLKPGSPPKSRGR